MSTAEFNTTRQELIQWINSLKDSSLLNLLLSIKLSAAENKNDWWKELSENERKKIKAGLKDMEQGKTITSTDFWNKLKGE